MYKRVTLYHIITKLHSISTKGIQRRTFFNAFANFNPRIHILSVLDCAQAGVLKNVQNLFLRCLGSRENVKQKYTSNQSRPQYSPFQIWSSHHIFVNNFRNFNPRIRILLFLDSAKTGLLKNIQNHSLRWFTS